MNSTFEIEEQVVPPSQYFFHGCNLTYYFLCASFITDILKTEEREEIGHFTN